MDKSIQCNDRRKDKRFTVQDKVFAVTGAFSEILGPLIDISKGGFAVSCVDYRGNLDNISELGIVCLEDNFDFKKIPHKTISDIDLQNISAEGAPVEIRRYSVQFGELSNAQNTKLAHFISHYTV